MESRRPRRYFLKSWLHAVRAFHGKCRAGSGLLMNTAWASAALLGITVALSLFDPRTLAGASVWVKPAKFAASVVVMAPALAWVLAQMAPLTRGLRRAAGVFATGFAIELVLITMQAARGVPSHFNFTSPFDGIVFGIMAFAIVAFWLAQIWLTFQAFRRPFADAALGWGLRMALLIATLGAGTAFTMTKGPTPAQEQALARGQPTMIGAHAVGVEDGGAGLPITRWSTQGGDLRVPHFLGLHALQVLPLLASLIARRRRDDAVEANRRSGRVVIALGIGYAGLVVTTLVQALRGRPLFAPDGTTYAVAVVVALVTAGALMRAWLLPARQVQAASTNTARTAAAA